MSDNVKHQKRPETAQIACSKHKIAPHSGAARGDLSGGGGLARSEIGHNPHTDTNRHYCKALGQNGHKSYTEKSAAYQKKDAQLSEKRRYH